MSDVAADSHSGSWPIFSAQPFRSDGGSSLVGLATLTFVTCVTGGLIGLLAGFISQWFFLVLLFPLGMGVVIGAVGAFGVTAGKVRMPLVCGAAGFLGGCVAVAAMHGFEYYQFEQEMKQVPPEIRALARMFDQLQNEKPQDPNVQKLLDELLKDPDTRRGLAVNSLLSYIDMKAHHGVEISRARGGGKGLNLGYVGSYCYWGFELLLIAGVAFAILKGAAEEPFCTRCENWKKSEVVATFEGSAPNIREAVNNGELSNIPRFAGVGDKLTAMLFSCPQCGAESPVDVRLNKVTTNDKGEDSVTALGTATYPGEATEPLRQAFAAAEQATQQARDPVKPLEVTEPDTPEQPA